MSTSEKAPSRVSSAAPVPEQNTQETTAPTEVKQNSSRPPSSTPKPSSRPASAAVPKTNENQVTTGSRPSSAKPGVDLSTQNTTGSRVSSAQVQNTPPATDDQAHGYSIVTDDKATTNESEPATQASRPSSAAPGGKQPSRPSSAAVTVADKQPSRPASAAANTEAPRPSSAAVQEQKSSRPPSAAVNSAEKPASRVGSATVEKQGSRPASAAGNAKSSSRPASAAAGTENTVAPPTVEEKTEDHQNPTEPIIGPPPKKPENAEEVTNSAVATLVENIVAQSVTVETQEQTEKKD